MSVSDPDNSRRESLQGDLRRRSSYLVVCGATDPEDGYIFSDFMGFCMGLKEHGVGGDFYSCFPLLVPAPIRCMGAEHFAILQKASPPVDTIKFGAYGEDKTECLYSYSRHSYDRRELFFRPIGNAMLADSIISWIKAKQQRATNGDSINIIFEGHGHKQLGFKAGDKHIPPKFLAELVEEFDTGVQVNIITGACYSGQFSAIIQDSTEGRRYVTAASGPSSKAYSCTRSASNRIRNSRFSHACVQSLAKMNLPGVPRRKVIWRAKDHKDLLRARLMRNLTPGAQPTGSHFYATASVDSLAALKTLIFCDKIDVLYDQRVAARRRRIEWPAKDENVWRSITGENADANIPERSISPDAIALVKDELAKCDTRAGFRPRYQHF